MQLKSSYCQNKPVNKNNLDNYNISISIIENEGPSWVYKISTSLSDSVDIEVRDIENKILSSDKVFIKDNYISKFSVYTVASSRFYLVILKQQTEIYRKEFIKNTNR